MIRRCATLLIRARTNGSSKLHTFNIRNTCTKSKEAVGRSTAKVTSVSILAAGSIFAFYTTAAQRQKNHETNMNVAYGICGINTAIFLGLNIASRRSPEAHSALHRYVIASTENLQKRRYHTILTSNFAHESLFHYACNTIGLYSFMSFVSNIISPKELLGMILASGIFSILGELLFMRMLGLSTVVLGTSGIVFSLIGYTATLSPDLRLSIFFIPNFNFSAKEGLYAFVAFDIVGTLLAVGYRMGLVRLFSPVAHRAHLLGVGVGILFARNHLKKKNSHKVKFF